MPPIYKVVVGATNNVQNSNFQKKSKRNRPHKYLKRAYSKDTLSTYNAAPKGSYATVYPEFSFQAVLEAVNNDPTTRGAILAYVDRCMEGDYAILKRDSLEYDKQLEGILDEKFMFRTDILRKIFLLGKLFNNVFVEIVRFENQVKSLNVLDSLNVEPVTEPNGDPIEYKTRITNPQTGNEVRWAKEDIVWIKFGDRSVGYAPVDLRSLWETLLFKDYVRRYASWLWKTGQYRVLWNPRQASDADIQSALSFMRRYEEDFRVPFVFKGELQTSVLRDFKEAESIERLMKYLDSQILIALRIPPIEAGIPDASGRSNADAQSNNLDAHITSTKKIVEDKISYELFPKMNKGNNLLRFAPNNRFIELQILQNIQIMASAGFTQDAMTEYMRDRGMFFGSKVFEPKPDPMMMDNPRNLDTMPSRQKKAPGAANKKVGTGTQGTTREGQL